MAFCVRPLSRGIVFARFIHAAGRSAHHSFYRHATWHDTDTPPFVHPTIRYRHPGCLYFLVIVNNSLNIRVKMFMRTRLQFSWVDG